MVARQAPAAGEPQLTPREAEVLRYLRLRLTNREIAERLVVSTRTVESHVASLLAKFGKTSRRELAETAAALDLGTAEPGSLPEPLDSFIGRSEDQDDVTQLFRSHRLVTLTGPPGVGKTRLAVEVARRISADYAGGARFVELAPVADPTDVANRVMMAIGGRQLPGQDALTTLAAEARTEPMLLLVDNCEHVSAAVAAVVQALLTKWPQTVVLATSREPLRVPGEFVRPVRPLTVPDPAATEPARVLAAESVRLLLDRARASGAGLSVTDSNAPAVALLCRSLDGLPLAVELAAGRLRTLTPEQLGDRLDAKLSFGDTGPGSERRTLRTAIERSYAGLTATEQLVFISLAVFPGAFSLDAVETICPDVAAPSDVVDTFAALVDRSLVTVVPSGAVNRYRLLDTLHAFADEKLPDSDREQLARRHAAYFVDVAERAEPRLHGGEAREWLARLRAEQDDLVQAQEWSLTHDPVLALRLVGALWQFWQDTDQRHSGIEWAERALAVDVDGPAELRLKALLAAATLIAPWNAPRCAQLVADATVLAGELDQEEWWARTRLAAATSTAYAAHPTPEEQATASKAALQAADFFRSVGDDWLAAEAFTSRSLLQSPRDATVALAEARRLYEQEGDELRAANCAYMTAAMLVRDLDDPARAAQLAEEAAAMAVRVGSEHEMAHARSILAEVHLREGSEQLATEMATECLEVFRRAADHRCVSAMLLVLGTTAAKRGDDDTAVRHLREALDVARYGAHARTVPLVQAQLAALRR